MKLGCGVTKKVQAGAHAYQGQPSRLGAGRHFVHLYSAVRRRKFDTMHVYTQSIDMDIADKTAVYTDRQNSKASQTG